MVKIVGKKEESDDEETTKVSVLIRKALRRSIGHAAADNDCTAAEEIRVTLEEKYGKYDRRK